MVRSPSPETMNGLSQSFQKKLQLNRRACLPADEQRSDRSLTSSTSTEEGSSGILASSPPVATSRQIRTRFLNRLGIQDVRQPPPLPRVDPRSMRKTVSFTEPLKGEEAQEPPLASSLNDSSTSSSSASVSFDNSVTVIPIPARSDYSDRIKHVLWTPTDEIQRNAMRNTYEFAAEGWDWQQANEEMVEYNGELIHPIHFMQEYSMVPHFTAVMAAQQQQEYH